MRAILIAASAVLATVFALGGAAQAQIATRPGQVVTSLTAEDVEWLANQGGHSSVERQPDVRIDVDTQQGFKFTLQGEACTGSGKAMRCEGLALFAYWTLDAGDAGKVAPVIAAFNREFPAAKTFMWEEAAAMERYVIVTGGVTVENLLGEIEVFLILSDEFWTLIDKATTD